MAMSHLPQWFRDYLARYKGAVALALALGLVASGCAALLMFTSGYLISETAHVGIALFTIMVPVACVQLFGFGRPLARYAERLASHDWVLHVTSDLRLSLYHAVSANVSDPSKERATGEYLSLLADDVAHLQNLYLRVVFPTVIAYALALATALFFGFFSISYALVVALSLVAVVVLLPMASLLATRMLAVRTKAMKAEEYAVLTDDVSGAVDWILSGRGDIALRDHVEIDVEIREAEARNRLIVRGLTFASVLLLVILLCGVVVWAGSRYGVPEANVNWIAAFALGFFPLIESFAMLPGAFAEAPAQRDSVIRLDDLLGDAQAPAQEAASAPLQALEGDGPAIELQDVRYRYPHSTKVALDGLTLAIDEGSSVAVLGRSGAGKSTFARVLCGLLAGYDGSARLFGREVPEWGSGLTRVVSYVGQNPYLFNRTLRDNLTMGVSDADDDELIAALAEVGLAAKFESLPDGLDTVIGETGVGFSGGEEHRVAIARALVAKAAIMVVDEPFSALDPETERELLDALLDNAVGRTLVVITHHLAQIDKFDRVIFIEDGVVDLDGSPAELRERSERFKSLVEFDR